jgi:predicted PurR-regulated permease PerM
MLLKLDGRVLRILWTLAVCYLAYVLRNVILLLVLSAVAAYMVLPLVEFVYRYVTHHRHRGWALGIVYFPLFGIIVSGGAVIGYYAFAEATSLAEQVPDITQPAAIEKIRLPSAFAPWDAQIHSQLQSWVEVHGKDMLQTLTSLSMKLLTAVGSVFTLLIVLLLSFMLLRNWPSLRADFMNMLPPDRRAQAAAILRDEHVMMAQWTRAIVLVAIGAAILYGIGYGALGLPYSVLLALIAFPFEFVPMIGPFVGFAIALLITFLSGYHHFLWMILFFAGARLLVDYVIQPYFLSGGSLRLPPFVVIVGAIAGEALGGIIGVLLSIPVIATIRILYNHLAEFRSAQPEAQEVPSERASPMGRQLPYSA